MKVVGMLRIKNESRWIAKSIGSILPLCDRVIVLDDHSTDDTVAICAALPKVTILQSPFTGLNETRDKNFLLEQALQLKPEYVIHIDGDEMLMPGCEAALLSAMQTPYTCISPRILYLWDAENQVRVDGVYGDFHRESMFRPGKGRFVGSPDSPNFHCGNVPIQERQKRHVTDAVTLLHFGYLHQSDRLRKWDWYNANDPQNAREGYDARHPERRSYPHVVQGDLPEVPADVKLMHGGPLRLEALS